MLHELKTDPEVFEDVLRGSKTYELRFNDRGFCLGDTLLLRETVASGAHMKSGALLDYTGRAVLAKVTHILRGPIYGLAEGWCIMSIRVSRQCEAWEKAKDALKFYACPPDDQDFDLGSWQERMNEDGGDIARAALKALEAHRVE